MSQVQSVICDSPYQTVATPVITEIWSTKIIPVIIFAGGKGTRLAPLTHDTPKALLPYQDVPLISHIMEQFYLMGFSDFTLILHEKADHIVKYVDSINVPYSINCLIEETPFGTAGGLSLLNPKPTSPFFVTNCDTIINVDYSSIYQFHQENDFQITIVSARKSISISYGIMTITPDQQLDELIEKPSYTMLVNTGLYLLNPEISALIPFNEPIDMTSLIQNAQEQEMRIGVYVIDESNWLDFGEWDKYNYHQQTELK